MKKNKISYTKKELFWKILLTAALLLIAIMMVFPIAWMLSASFKHENVVFNIPIEWIPKQPTLSNFITAFTDFPYIHWYMNTIMVTIMVVILVLTVSSLAGYAFAKLEFSGKNIIFMLFISTMMIPVQVRIIPQFVIFKHLHLINTLASVYMPWMFNAFSIFMMRQFFMSIPNELIEAARIDGSGEFKTFFKVVIPLAKSQLSALLILAFTWGWNDYFGPLVYISDINKQVLSVGIGTFKGQYSSNFAVQMAGATLALIPIVIVYLCAQKNFIEGIALSGVKG